MTVDFDVYQMPERLGGDWAFRIGFPLMLISDGYESEQAAREAALARVAAHESQGTVTEGQS
jgi:hypothetical protein